MTAATFEQISTLFRSSALMSELSDAEIDELIGCVRHLHFDADETVFAQGTRGTVIYFVVTGRVKITSLSPDGSEMLFSMVEAGDFFGEISVIDGGIRSVNAIAEQPTYAVALDRRNLMPVVEGNPKAAMSVARLVCRHLREAITNVETVGRRAAPARILGRLIYLSQNYGRVDPDNGAMRIDHGQSQQSMADSVGLTRVMVNRQFGIWRDDGLIEVGRGFTVIRDLKALEAVVWGDD